MLYEHMCKQCYEGSKDQQAQKAATVQRCLMVELVKNKEQHLRVPAAAEHFPAEPAAVAVQRSKAPLTRSAHPARQAV